MQNLLDPAILFFVFGVVAGALRSNLEIPKQIAKFLSLYLLMALGLKGGFALAKSGFGPEVLISLSAAVIMAFSRLRIGQRGHVRDCNAIFRKQWSSVRWPHGCCNGVDGVTRNYHGSSTC